MIIRWLIQCHKSTTGLPPQCSVTRRSREHRDDNRVVDLRQWIFGRVNKQGTL